MVNTQNNITVQNQPLGTNFGQVLNSVIGAVNNVNNRDVPVSNVVSNISRQLGIPEDDDSDSVIGQFMSVCTSEMNMIEMFDVMSGNWSPLDKIKVKVKYLITKLCKGDTSTSSRNRLVESWITVLHDTFVKNEQFCALVKNKPDLMESVCQICRFHLDLFVNLALEPTDSFSEPLQKFFTLFIGDLYSELKSELGDTDAKNALSILIDTYVSQSSTQIQLPNGLGSGMIMTLIEKTFQQYRQSNPDRVPKKCKAFTESIEIDDLLDDCFDQLSTSSIKEEKKVVKEEKKEIKTPERAPWMQGLSVDEIKEIETKLNSVDDEIHSDDEFSPAYKSGGSDDKKKEKKKEVKKQVKKESMDNVEID
jgi:hypothetical protein